MIGDAVETVCLSLFFFFNDTATTEIYTLSLHDALPISWRASISRPSPCGSAPPMTPSRSEEHTSELQSRLHLVCRLLLEKKNRLSISSEESVVDAPVGGTVAARARR